MRSSMRSAWMPVRLREVVSEHYCGPSPDCEERTIRDDFEWGLLKTTAITWKGWDESQHKVPPEAFWNQPALEVHAGDVLVTKAGPRHRVGVVVSVPSTRPRLMVSGKMIGLRIDRDRVVPRVLAGLLATRKPQKYLDERTTGMAESQVNFANATLLETPLELPLLPEQRRIAEILDTLDEAIRKTEQLIAKLRRVKQGLLHDLLTRGIDENGEIRDPKRHPKMFRQTLIGVLPASWEPNSLESVTSAPICYGIVQAGPFRDGGPFVITIGDLAGDFRSGLHRTSPGIDRNYARSRAAPGDLLLSIKGTIGRVAVVPPWFEGNISRDVARIRLMHRASPSFVRHYLASPMGQRQLTLAVVGTTRAEISIHVLKKLLIPLGERSEQDEIATRIDGMDRRLEAETDHLEKLQAVQEGLKEDLLTGRVRVSSHESAA